MVANYGVMVGNDWQWIVLGIWVVLVLGIGIYYWQQGKELKGGVKLDRFPWSGVSWKLALGLLGSAVLVFVVLYWRLGK